MLLKSEPLVSSLSLYDIRGAPGVAADVSHVDTSSQVGNDEKNTTIILIILFRSLAILPISSLML